MPDARLLDHPWIKRRKRDVAEYLRIAEAGILREDDPIELIEGQSTETAPLSGPRSRYTSR